MKELVNQELLIFPKYQMDAKTSSALWNGGGNMKPWFQLLTFWLNKYWGLLVFKLKLKESFLLLGY